MKGETIQSHSIKQLRTLSGNLITGIEDRDHPSSFQRTECLIFQMTGVYNLDILDLRIIARHQDNINYICLNISYKIQFMIMFVHCL